MQLFTMNQGRTKPSRAVRPGFTLVEVLVSGMILAVGMSALLTLASRALSLQARGEHKIIAAALLDEILSSVLTEGPQDFTQLHPTSGPFDPPFEAWEYSIDIDDAIGLSPFAVRATVLGPDGSTYHCDTLVAPKLGEEPDPERLPFEPIDREGRWQEMKDEELPG